MAVKKSSATKTQPVKADVKGKAKAKVAPEVPPQKPAPLPKPKTITKGQLINTIAKNTGIMITEADAIVSEVIAGMIEALKKGEEIELRGFGTFRIRERKARTGRNPKTGAVVEIPAKQVVYFTLGKEIKALLKNK